MALDGWCDLTCKEVPNLLNEVAEIIVGTLHLVLGVIGFLQRCLGFVLRLLSLGLGICHLKPQQKKNEHCRVWVKKLSLT